LPKILIADDDPLLCQLLRLKLEAAGYDVTIVTDGAAALEETQQTAPDMLVLDSMMPVMSGPEVLRALKGGEATSDIPVIMLTARKGQSDIVDALRGGAADYITKPFLPDELAARIAAALARREAGNARSGAL
jgi:DNA-binding response OmpR family regulator